MVALFQKATDNPTQAFMLEYFAEIVNAAVFSMEIKNFVLNVFSKIQINALLTNCCGKDYYDTFFTL